MPQTGQSLSSLASDAPVSLYALAPRLGEVATEWEGGKMLERIEADGGPSTYGLWRSCV